MKVRYWLAWTLFGSLSLTLAGGPLWAQSALLPSPAVQSAPYVPASSSSSANRVEPGAEADPGAILLTIHKRVDEVNVFFTATDRHGHFIKNLRKEDFSFLDDHQPPQSILYFRREADMPLRLGLLVDESGSVSSRFDFEQQAAIEFLRQTLRPQYDRAFVLGFNSHQEVPQDFTNSTDKLARAIHRLHAGGGTALYDAIYLACRDRLLHAEGHAHDPVRRAIILLSDGEDNQSVMTREAALEMAQRAEVVLYAISTDDSGLIMRGDQVLEQLAESTGGRAFFPFKIKDITKSFSSIQEELRSQYAVAYKPANLQADGRFRSIEITAQNKNLRVRSRKGYFAPSQ